MRWAALVLFILLAMPASAFAAQQTSVEPGTDGTLIVIGSGWRPTEMLVVRLGTDQFVAYTDSSGSFELTTGLYSYEGALVVRRADPSMLATQVAARPSPLAVFFAESVAHGAALLAICLALLGALSMTTRALAGKRR